MPTRRELSKSGRVSVGGCRHAATGFARVVIRYRQLLMSGVRRRTLRALGVDRADSDITVLELPEPPQPGPGQVLIGVVAAGMGPWDRLLYNGGGDVGLQLPAALGMEGSGSVLRVGSEVTGFQVGDRVLAHAAPLPGGSGFWSEQVLVGAAIVAHCPPGLDSITAAALPIAGLTARQAIDELKIRAGSRLLITGGAGATGAAAVQI